MTLGDQLKKNQEASRLAEYQAAAQLARERQSEDAQRHADELCRIEPLKVAFATFLDAMCADLKRQLAAGSTAPTFVLDAKDALFAELWRDGPGTHGTFFPAGFADHWSTAQWQEFSKAWKNEGLRIRYELTRSDVGALYLANRRSVRIDFKVGLPPHPVQFQRAHHAAHREEPFWTRAMDRLRSIFGLS